MKNPTARWSALICLASVAVVSGCLQGGDGLGASESTAASKNSPPAASPASPPVDAPLNATAVATFAGGCFWCMEGAFEALDGVESAVSGYTGGHTDNPTYEQVCSNATGHTEAVQVKYDPSRVSYETLLEVFWRQIDPTDIGGQFADRGSSYRPEIFVHDDAQRTAAEKSKAALQASGRFKKEIVTPITTASTFWTAEGKHQDFYKTNSSYYKRYRSGSGRGGFLERTWGEDAIYTPPTADQPEVNQPATRPAGQSSAKYKRPSDAEIKAMLTQQQYYVTQKDGTERPFQNEFWDNKRAGIYVDVVTGEPLFSSKDKFKSGTGWPSFTQPIRGGVLTEQTDYHVGYARTEVRSKIADSHLGHVFKDGPAPTGLRYCINSAALRFIPEADLDKEGYGEFKSPE